MEPVVEMIETMICSQISPGCFSIRMGSQSMFVFLFHLAVLPKVQPLAALHLGSGEWTLLCSKTCILNILKYFGFDVYGGD
jgi:hypothetical protein